MTLGGTGTVLNINDSIIDGSNLGTFLGIRLSGKNMFLCLCILLNKSAIILGFKITY